MGARRFQDLIAWQLARELRKYVVDTIRETPLSGDKSLCDQMRRAARSVTNNIAEGFPCPSHAEFARFLDIAGRSIRELEDGLIEATDNGLLTQSQAAPGFNLAKRTSVAVSRLAKYLRDNP